MGVHVLIKILLVFFVTAFFAYSYIILGLVGNPEIVPAHYPNWVGSLSCNTKLCDIVFPGTHDSLAYCTANIRREYNTSSKNNLFNRVRKLRWLPGLGYKITRWSRAHRIDIKTQLSRGIRCFDMRVALGIDSISYGEHTFTFDNFQTALLDIKKFIQNNPKEILIIRYTSTSAVCDNLLLRHLEASILPKVTNVTELTLGQFYARCINIVITSNSTSEKLSKYIQSDLVYHDWKNTFDIEEKREYITSSLKDFRNPAQFFNLDWTVTPQEIDFVLSYSNLIHSSANMNSQLSEFLVMIREHGHKIGIISVDASESLDLISIINNQNK